MNRREVFKLAGAAAAVIAVGGPATAAPLTVGEPVALTLPQMAAMAEGLGKTKAAAFIQNFVGESDLLRVMPFTAVPGGAYSYQDEGRLPGVAFFGQPQLRSDGVLNPPREALKIVGGDIDVDLALVERRPFEERMYAMRLGMRFTDMLVNGDHTVDPRQPHGLKNRIIGDQLIDNGACGLKLSKLDAGIGRVDNASHLLMSKRMRNLLAAASRQVGDDGMISWSQDEFGARLASYTTVDGKVTLPILVTDYNDVNVQIIDFGEPDYTTSIYVLNLSDEGVQGLHNGEVEIDDLGLIENPEHLELSRLNTPVYRTRAEWLATLGVMSGRAAARVHNIKPQAVTL